MKWKKDAGFANAHSKLCTCFRGKDSVDDVCWFAHNGEKGGKSGEDIHKAMNWIAGHMPEENAAMNWIKMIATHIG